MSSARLVRIVTAVALAAMGLIVRVAPAHAAADPLGDPDAQGGIAFCVGGRQVTSGTIDTRPFVPIAVSSVPAPPGYAAPHGKATLMVFQPRKGVDPMDWSGKEMTAPTSFTDSNHPMAAATSLDAALADFVSAFPPSWHGLVQFRLWFTAGNYPQHLRPYPAAIVKVNGNRWTELNAPKVACDSGKAKSVEKVALPPSTFHSVSATPGADSSAGSRSGSSAGSGTSPAATDPAGHTTSSAGAAGSKPTTSSGAPAGGADASSMASPDLAPVAADKGSSHGSSAGLLWTVVVIVAVLSVGAVAFQRRRRGSAAD